MTLSLPAAYIWTCKQGDRIVTINFFPCKTRIEAWRWFKCKVMWSNDECGDTYSGQWGTGSVIIEQSIDILNTTCRPNGIFICHLWMWHNTINTHKSFGSRPWSITVCGNKPLLPQTVILQTLTCTFMVIFWTTVVVSCRAATNNSVYYWLIHQSFLCIVKNNK